MEDDATIFLLHRALSLLKQSLGALWESCFLNSPVLPKPYTTCASEGPAGALDWTRLPPITLDPRLPHQQNTRCEGTRLWVRPGGLQCGLGSFSLQSSTLQTSCTSLTTTTCNDYVIVCLITDQDDREDRELTRDFVEWTLGLRTAWVFNLTINWTGQTTPNALYKRGQSRLYLLSTLMALVLTLFCGAIYWGCRITADRKRPDKLIKKASSVLRGQRQEDHSFTVI